MERTQSGPALISVIVPVYKSEAFLGKCVESLLAQSFQDFELLLVDDGSPDDSGAMCDAYAAKDSRVRVIHKPNGGVSSARNAGLDAARGDYVVFVDSDDYVDPSYLEGASAAGAGAGSGAAAGAGGAGENSGDHRLPALHPQWR